MKRKLFIAALVATILCASLGAWWFFCWPEEPPTREALIAIASDAGKTRNTRAKAIFRLFADYIPPNANAAAIREVFGTCDWIAEARVFSQDLQAGEGHPLWALIAGELFSLHLFDHNKRSAWVIYVRLSGGELHDPSRFFGPKAGSDPRTKRVEFALWNLKTGQQEVFDASGRHPPKHEAWRKPF
jgi:hypothetical protein